MLGNGTNGSKFLSLLLLGQEGLEFFETGSQYSCRPWTPCSSHVLGSQACTTMLSCVFCLVVVLGIKPKALNMLSKCSSLKLQDAQPPRTVFSCYCHHREQELFLCLINCLILKNENKYSFCCIILFKSHTLCYKGKELCSHKESYKDHFIYISSYLLLKVKL
jgi:hypothetical protein